MKANEIKRGIVFELDGKHIMVTTGQIMICASEHTLHYRPIWSEMEFKYAKLNNTKTKTYTKAKTRTSP